MANKIKRAYLKYLIWKNKRLSKKHKPNDEQKKAIRISKRLISDPESLLYCSAENLRTSTRYIIENGHLYVKITDDKIRIINGTYKYDVSFSETDPNMSSVRKVFADEMEKRLDQYEEKINYRVGRSLDVILREIVNKK